MAGTHLDRARRDSRRFITRGGFQDDIVLKTVDGNTIIETTGLVSKHWLGISSDGLPANSKSAHITISEADLVFLEYPIRNAQGEIDLKDHKVGVADSSGVLKNYVIKESFPSETIGLIACILADFE